DYYCSSYTNSGVFF
nr:immunoglobulin light chain junction region [Macaca mulatta]